MTDFLYDEFERELIHLIGREPIYEEVIEYMEKKMKITKDQEREYYERKYYGN